MSDSHVTAFVGFDLSGRVYPTFLIYKGSAWSTYRGRLVRLPPGNGWGATQSASGSQTKTKGTAGNVVGTFQTWSKWLVGATRETMREEGHVIHILDNHSSREDDVGLQCVSDANMSILSLPVNTSHFFQVRIEREKWCFSLVILQIICE